jgi:hypothetical protein
MVEIVRENVMLTKVRLSYNSLFKKKTYDENSTPKYEATLLIPKTDKKTIKIIQDAYGVVSLENFGKKMEIKTSSEKAVLRDGDELKPDEEAFTDHYFMVAKNAKKVLLLDGKKRPVEDEEESPFYSGCYVNAKIQIYPILDKQTKGIYASLEGLMFAGDGEPLGGGGKGASVEDFEDFEEVDAVEDEEDF